MTNAITKAAVGTAAKPKHSSYVSPAILRLRSQTDLNWDTATMRDPLPFLQSRNIRSIAGQEGPAPVQPKVASKPVSPTVVPSDPTPAKTADVQPEAASESVSTAAVPSDPSPAKTADVESRKSLFQTLTQRKVLIAAGAVLSIAATAGAAYYFYPVATAAHAALVGNACRAALMNTHQLFIQPGLANSLFMVNLIKNAVIIPAAKITLPILSSVISTAIVATVGILVFLCVANRVWVAAKAVIWGAGSAVVNKFGQELDKTYVGMAAKAVIVTIASPFIAPFMAEEKSETTPDVDTAKIMPAREDDEESEVELRPLLEIADSSEPSVEEVDGDEDEEQIDTLRADQEKAQSSWGTFLTVIAETIGAGPYFSPKLPQMDVLTGQ